MNLPKKLLNNVPSNEPNNYHSFFYLKKVGLDIRKHKIPDFFGIMPPASRSGTFTNYNELNYCRFCLTYGRFNIFNKLVHYCKTKEKELCASTLEKPL